MADYERWYCTNNDLRDLDARKARDLIIECFFQAQHETMLRSQERLGFGGTEESLRMQAEGAVRNAFRRTGGDYAQPTRESLRQAVESLASSAESLGTPREIIDHHKRQIGLVLNGLSA